MNFKILVMYANEYEIEGKRGAIINFYFFGQNGEALNTQTAPNGSVGYQRAKVSLPWEKRTRVMKAPAIYDAVLEMSVGSDGKPVMKVTDLNYCCDVSITAAGDKHGK